MTGTRSDSCYVRHLTEQSTAPYEYLTAMHPSASCPIRQPNDTSYAACRQMHVGSNAVKIENELRPTFGRQSLKDIHAGHGAAPYKVGRLPASYIANDWLRPQYEHDRRRIVPTSRLDFSPCQNVVDLHYPIDTRFSAIAE